MRIPPDRVNVLVENLRRWDPWPDCDVCKCTEWGVHDTVYQLPEFHGVPGLMGGAFIPVVIIQCKQCGQIKTFSASAVGVVDPPQKADQLTVGESAGGEANG